MLDIVVLVALSALAEERAVSSLFNESGRTTVTESGMTVVRAPQPHVLVARIEDDGTLATACVTTENAVDALLAAGPPRKE